MTAAPSFHLPEELVYLMESVQTLPAEDIAFCALPHLERFSDAAQKAEIGAQLLTNISHSRSPYAAEASKALAVMAKFPHYPRPRAAVAMAALKGLAGNKAAA
jgi:hypothetical protein